MPGEPDLAHPTRAKRRDQAIAAHGQGFVQLLLVDLEHGALAEEDRAFQHRSQLTDVSGPRVGLEAGASSRARRRRSPSRAAVRDDARNDRRAPVCPPADRRAEAHGCGSPRATETAAGTRPAAADAHHASSRRSAARQGSATHREVAGFDLVPASRGERAEGPAAGRAPHRETACRSTPGRICSRRASLRDCVALVDSPACRY